MMDSTAIKPKSPIKKRVRITFIVILCLTLVVYISQEVIGLMLFDHYKPITLGNFGLKASEARETNHHVGDIFLINIQSSPHIGDLVFYDAETNDSFCMTFGGGVYMAKIIGLPGDTVKFYENSYEIRGKTYPAERRYYIGNELKIIPMVLQYVKWGEKTFDNLAGQTLTIPEGQYLTDEWIGQECLPGIIFQGSTAMANRYTLKREAIIGVVLVQIGHSWIFERNQKGIIY
ncbi:MAG: S26 family signal peptidase [Dehalococcoidales bacterium]|nr:S26 family signal peptidase [Dehalococcoidales bacterium]